MTTKTAIIGGIAALGLCITGLYPTAARAQTAASNGSRVGGHIGIYLPGSGGLKRVNNRTWATAGVTYGFQPPGKRTFLDGHLYFDYAGGNEERLSQSTFQSVSRGREVLGLGVATRFALYMGRVASVYAGVGGGLYRRETYRSYERYYDNDASDDFFDEDDRVSEKVGGIRGGYKLFGGFQIRQGLFAEATYHSISSMDKIPYGGVSLAIGYRR